MAEPRPNFFIVGAPKCGTSALAQYLAEHANIHFSIQKEPNYFCSDFPGIQIVKTEADYLKLFAGATDDHVAIGEGSIRYMYSQNALEGIKQFDADAKIILMLRNPIDLLYSFHAQVLFVLHEDVENFEEAWDLQETRQQGDQIPSTCQEPFFLQYREIGSLGKYTAKVLDAFPPDQVKIILFDDFVKDTRGVYDDVLQFLDVPDDGRTDFPPVNERKKLKSKWLAAVVDRQPLWFRNLKQRVFGVREKGFLDFLRRYNSVPDARPQVSPEMRERLTEIYRDDVSRLSALINRDLSGWLAEDGTEAPSSLGASKSAGIVSHES